MTDETPKLTAEGVETLKMLDDGYKAPPADHFPTFRQWFMVAITIYARLTWIFRGGPSGMAGQTEGITNAFVVLKRENLQLAGYVQELRRRLDHHERGPLQASRRDLDRQRNDGMIRTVAGKGKKSIVSLD